MAYLWDYDEKVLKRTKKGKIFLLERMINYGPGKGRKIRLSEVKKYWHKLNLFTLQKRLFELLIWGKYKSSPKTKKSFLMR
ncbi:hypothetical protein COV89_03190 [Candidatus Shapirobacteria bacterium CG11_big_fil_rev_8_21_14_0_20_40_12]|uniref:Uncharacterized protein n=1 Tax=Candidatus Shapirobacteria bacterium CG11_big_fil_rev_8_21_14_0_20_40_12 TaxID=1974889 RepID=A0A2H0KFC4_9BACT|nr:MAG: hypothetical protein COV89_03190 [Candidatus Shapirobacteria bacterium CG11_big_fil_rev_8_21_14_0_20_40_12]